MYNTVTFCNSYVFAKRLRNTAYHRSNFFCYVLNSKVRLKPILLILLLGHLLFCSLYVATNSYVKNRIFSYNRWQVTQRYILSKWPSVTSNWKWWLFWKRFWSKYTEFTTYQNLLETLFLPSTQKNLDFLGWYFWWWFFLITVGNLLIYFKVKEVFAKNFILGFATLLFLQTVLNIGFYVKIIPLFGDTLPFFLKGDAICNLIGIGFLLQLTKEINRWKIILVGGGTAGHFYPLMAVTDKIRREVIDEKLQDPKNILFWWKKTMIRYVLQRGVKYSYVMSGKNRLYFSFKNFIDIFKTLIGIKIAFWNYFLYIQMLFFQRGVW